MLILWLVFELYDFWLITSMYLLDSTQAPGYDFPDTAIIHLLWFSSPDPKPPGEGGYNQHLSLQLL
jgi:hypothetical protein